MIDGRVGVGISGLGSCLPETVVTNADLERILDTSDEWIQRRTGIKTRRVSTEKESLPILMAVAAERALQSANCLPEDIAYIFAGTNSTDNLLVPHVAARVQHLIGAYNATCPDIGAGCSGAMFASEFAIRTIRDRWMMERIRKDRKGEKGKIKPTKVLVLGGDSLINVTDMGERSAAVVLGEGAGAMVYEPVFDLESGVQYISTGTDGSLGGLIHYGSGFGNQLVVDGEGIRFEKPGIEPEYFRMDGRRIHKLVLSRFPGMIIDAVEGAGMEPEILKESVIVPHQMNRRTIEESVERLERKIGFKVGYVHAEGAEKYGNNSTASMLIGLDEVYRSGRMEIDTPVIGVVFGAGMTWGAFMTRWDMEKFEGIREYDVEEQREIVGRLNEKYDDWKDTLAK